MKYSVIDEIDIKLSNLGFGCLQLGGYGWGKASENEIVAAIHKAIDCGITLFDTAPIYGLGHSEEVLGKTLGARRKEAIIATKVGLIWKKNKTFEKFTDSSPANIEREIEMSLRRLQTDYIDIYQIHWPDTNTPIEDTLLAMEKLKKAGKIRCIGYCNISSDLLREALKYAPVKSVQIPYNLLDREVEQDLLPFCKNNSMAVLVYSPLARGLLSGKFGADTIFGLDDHRSRSGDGYFGREVLAKNLEIVDRVKLIAQKWNKTPAQIALSWVLQNPCVTTAISGVETVAQVIGNVAISDFALSKEDMEFLSGGVRTEVDSVGGESGT